MRNGLAYVPCREPLMHLWRRSSLAVVALLALLASIVPASAWSCPMTGRIGSAAFVCEGMKQPCVHAGSPCCCHPVTLPPGGLLPRQEPGQVLVATPAAPRFEVNAPSVERVSLAAVLPAESRIVPPAARGWDRAAPAFVLRSRHGPPMFSGRAPPVA